MILDISMDSAWDNSANNLVEVPISTNLVVYKLQGV
jgi:hypothetical protein